MSQTWLEVAREARSAASRLLILEHFRSCISRAYYAAYSKVAHELVHTAQLEMPPGREGPNHVRIRQLILTSMPNTQQAKRGKLSELLGRLYALRIVADYQPSRDVDAGDAREAVSIMKKLFESF